MVLLGQKEDFFCYIYSANDDNSEETIVNKLFKILPDWGGRIVVSSSNNQFQKYNNYKIINTCTIDYFILAMSFSSVLNENIWITLNKTSQNNCVNTIKSNLKLIIELVLNNKWNVAKTFGF